MKKKLNFGILAIVGVVVFSACGSDSDLFDPEKAAAKKEAQYASAFVQKYGEIAVDQDWGFGATPTTRVANTNSNQWKDFTEVPEGITATEKEVVTEWFKTHQNPQSIGVDWTDFFVQHVSGSHSNMDFLVAASDEHINYTIQYIGGAYYVGFDFEATGQNPNQQVAADGYYSDWIVKISPAVYTNAYRIIAEDLGDSDDFDFNDVVFDVATNGGATIITLQAAGGTLPLYIEVGGDSREVHELFGVSNTTMVNTDAGATKAPVMYRVNGTGAVNIKVEGQNAEVYTLKAEIGKAPQKIRVETRYEWTAERQDINDKYPGFADWVADPTANWY